MRIFNKARFKTIKTSGLRKYLIYAVGEIILVVIGILIALWINNWNQTEKENDRQRYVAQNVLEQMKKDVIEIDKVIGQMDEQDQIFELLLMDREPTLEEKLIMLQKAPFLITLNLIMLNLEPKVINQLAHTNVTQPQLKSILNNIESDYVQTDRVLRLSEEMIIKEMLSNLEYIRDNYDWYYRLIGGRNLDVSEYAYFGSNHYRNRVAHMELIAMDSYYSDLVSFQFSLNQHIKELEAAIEVVD